MPWCNESGRWFTVDPNAIFKECDALVRLQDRRPTTGCAVPLPNLERNMPNLKSALFPWHKFSAQSRERFHKKRTDVMRLELASFSTIHHFTNLLNFRLIERFVR